MEYTIYIFPFMEKHDLNKYCFNLENLPENLEDFISNSKIEEHFQNNKCCAKCAFYAQLWYDNMIIEKRDFEYSYKGILSQYSIKNLEITDIYKNINHNTLTYINPNKAKSVYNDLIKKRAYKSFDIEAYDITKDILEYIIEKYDNYNVILYMEYFI